MAHFLTAAETVLPLFLVILAGALFSHTKVSSPKQVGIHNKYTLSVQYKPETTPLAGIVVFDKVISVVAIPLWMVLVG